MLVFLDTEFTSLEEPYLISAGLVANDRELYFEVAGVTPEICSTFVKANVFPLLHGPKFTPLEIVASLAAFLEPGGNEITFSCDAPRYDFALLISCLPARFHVKYAVPSFEDEVVQQSFEKALQRAYDDGLRRHHAMDDARALASAWMSI